MIAQAGKSPPTDGSSAPDFRFEPYGESAVLILLGSGIAENNYRRLASLADALRAAPPRGFQELVPAYDSCLVVFDPLAVSPAQLEASLRAAAAGIGSIPAAGPVRIVELPVAYGGDYGPDLATAAAGAGLSERAYIDLHAGKDYLIYMLGFSPGFPYLGGLDERLARPRLKSPRAKVAAGSVGIADGQTGVYPQDSPGGWNIIGRTPAKLFDPRREPPALLEAGSYLRFVPISAARFAALKAEAQSLKSAALPDCSPARPGLLVLKPGPLSIVVDAGRAGYQASGVPPSGPMDDYSMSLANLLAGNGRGEACIECTLGGMELLFERPAAFAVGGASGPLFLDGLPVARNRALYAEEGSVLSLGMAEQGLRSYVAVRGGFPLPPVMGSRTTFMRGGFGGLNGRALASGDRLPMAELSAIRVAAPLSGQQGQEARYGGTAPEAAIRATGQALILRAIPSHECGRFTNEGLRRFYAEAYTLSPNSDRMGCRLDGPAVEHADGADIVSSAVQTGTVQVPGDGQPIVLMADRQTTGGYTRIAQVIRADLGLLGQARPGQLVRFVKASVEDAIKALREREAFLQSLAISEPAKSARPARRYKVTVEGKAFDLSVEELV